MIDSDAATAAWASALEAPAWDGTPVWIHADLLRPNLLVDRGRLRAVIDFGGVGVGDPAADVIAAWSVFGRAGERVSQCARRRRRHVEPARGYALHQAALIIPYYAETNRGLSRWRSARSRRSSPISAREFSGASSARLPLPP